MLPLANGDIIVTLLPVNTKWPWITPALFRPELVPEELMAQGLTVKHTGFPIFDECDHIPIPYPILSCISAICIHSLTNVCIYFLKFCILLN